MSALRGALLGTVITAAFIAVAAVPGKGQIVGFIFAPSIGYLTWRAWRIGVRVRDDGVIVGGFLWAKRVPWTDIERFTAEPSGGYPYVGRIVRNGGHRPIVIAGFDSGRKATDKHRRQVQAPIDQLNAVLERWRADHANAQSPTA